MDELSWIVSTSGETKEQNFDPHGRIEFQDGLWRIRGRLQKDTRAVRLVPAHGGG